LKNVIKIVKIVTRKRTKKKELRMLFCKIKIEKQENRIKPGNVVEVETGEIVVGVEIEENQ
jgi:hypothetical protein